ncbi:MAG TPA: O-antigen ligase family protein [Thermoleophilaceae bacterium]|nr:O-antigen ligase family protein [Thermoleophilaceae bacterium]
MRRAAARAGSADLTRLAGGALLALPGLAVVYLGFNAGGFFPGATGLAAVVLIAVLAVRIVAAPDPLAGFSPAVALALLAMVLLSLWTLGSSAWSDSDSRALVEFDRVLLYAAALALFGTVERTPANVRRMLAGLALGMLVVCGAGLISRTLPDLLPVLPNRENSRLSYPLSYSNAVGLLAALATVFCFHFSADESGARWSRILGAAAVPALAATLLLTFSRAGIGALALALVVYAVVARPRGLAGAALAVLPASAVAAAAAYAADALAQPDPTTATAVAQGRNVLLIVAAAALGAGAVRWATLGLDRRLSALTVSRRTGRRAAAAVAVAFVAVVVATGLPGAVATQVERFTDQNEVPVGTQRDRLTEVGNNGRVDNWRVALDMFDEARLHGVGAGTYPVRWARDRPLPATVNDGHSLYLESLGELGLVGGGLLLLALATILVGAAVRTSQGPRALYGAVFTGLLTWVVHAGVDWDWEMPVGTLWVFAAGGLVLADAPGADRGARPPGAVLRVGLSLALLVVAITPASVALSQKRLNQSVDAFREGDCTRSVQRALQSNRAVPSRAEPLQLMAFCDARVPGLAGLSIRQMDAAVRRDPENWEFQYSLALVRGAAGRDPRPAARRALELNPWEPLTRQAVKRFATASRRAWVRRARSAQLPFQAQRR